MDARSETQAKAQGIVEPVLTDDILTSDPAAVAALDKVIRSQVLSDSLVRVKIWRADGTIVYSDEQRLIGQQYHLGDDEQEALAEGVVQAEVSDLTKPENRYERPAGKLLEVYLPIRTEGDTPVLFEAYYQYDAVRESGQRVWRSFAPLSLGRW